MYACMRTCVRTCVRACTHTCTAHTCAENTASCCGCLRTYMHAQIHAYILTSNCALDFDATTALAMNVSPSYRHTAPGRVALGAALATFSRRYSRPCIVPAGICITVCMCVCVCKLSHTRVLAAPAAGLPAAGLVCVYVCMSLARTHARMLYAHSCTHTHTHTHTHTRTHTHTNGHSGFSRRTRHVISTSVPSQPHKSR